MSDNGTRATDGGRRLGEALAGWLEAAERGEAPDEAEYLGRYPEVADELALHIADWRRFPRPAAAAPLGSGLLGDYRIVREVGRGGMGVVYEAVQVSLGRRVALKVLPFAATMDPRQLQRFHNEARAAAGLEHAHIVPVYGVGCERGVHFYAMKFIDGQTLAELIARQAPGSDDVTAPYARPSADTRPQAAEATAPAPRDGAFFRRAAEWGAQAADALEHAHSLGVVHRDVKPGNLLIDGGGTLWVADFGLARTAADSGLTVTGDVLGTLRYMSPEQALARHGLVDHRSDVYALGATLYELLTGSPAVGGMDRAEVLHNISSAEPRAPRALVRAVPAELETVVLKCLEKEPKDRYTSAKELADDLRHWLADEPVRARRPTLAQRARKWARRHRGLVGAAAAIVMALALGGAVSTVLAIEAAAQARRADERAEDADREAEAATQEKGRADREAKAARRLAGEERKARLKAETEADRADRVAHILQLELAVQSLHAGELGRARELLDGAPQKLRGAWEHRHVLDFLRRREAVHVLKGHTKAVVGVAISPDGKRIASGGEDMTVRVWDAETGQVKLFLKGHTGPVESVAFSPDGKRVASGGHDGAVLVWDAESGEQRILFKLNQWGEKGFVALVAFTRDGNPIALVSSDKTVQLWDVATGQKRTAIKSHMTLVDGVAISADGKRIASADLAKHAGTPVGQVGMLRVADAESGRELFAVEIKGNPGKLFGGRAFSLAYSPDGKRIAVALADGTVRVVDAKSGREALTLGGATDQLVCVAYSPDGQHIGCSSQDGTLRAWDAESGQLKLAIKGHTGATDAFPTGVAFSRDGRRIVSGGTDNTVRVWATASRQEQFAFRGPTPGARCLAISADGTRVLTEAPDFTLNVCDPERGRVMLSTKPSRGGMRFGGAGVFSPDGRRIVSGGRAKPMTVWDTETGTVRHRFTNRDSWASSIAVSTNGKRIASLDASRGAVTLWDAETGQLQRSLKMAAGDGATITDVAFSPDGKRLVAASLGLMVRAWDADTGREVLTLKEDAVSVRCVAYSPDGKRIVAGCRDQAVRAWDAETGRLLLTCKGHTGEVHSVAVSPDGGRIVSGGSDNTVRAWDSERGQQVLALRGHTVPVTRVRFSADGKRIISGGSDGTVRVWQAP